MCVCVCVCVCEPPHSPSIPVSLSLFAVQSINRSGEEFFEDLPSLSRLQDHYAIDGGANRRAGGLNRPPQVPLEAGGAGETGGGSRDEAGRGVSAGDEWGERERERKNPPRNSPCNRLSRLLWSHLAREEEEEEEMDEEEEDGEEDENVKENDVNK